MVIAFDFFLAHILFRELLRQRGDRISRIRSAKSSVSSLSW